MAVDGINYKDGFILTHVIERDGNVQLDVPYPLYHITLLHNNVNYYAQIPSFLIGQEVLVYIHYAVQDEEIVTSDPSWLGADWAEVSTLIPALICWHHTKEESWGTIVDGTSIPYDGADKYDIVHPYYVRGT